MKKRVRKIEVRSKTPKRARKFVVTFLVGVLLIPTTFALAELPSNEQPYPAELYAQCFDGRDNDGDGFADLRDIDCPKCFDGLDNEPDSFVDMADPDCPKIGGSVLGATNPEMEEADTTIAETRVAQMRTADMRVAQTRIAQMNASGQCRRVIVFRKIVPDPINGFRYEYEFFCDDTVGTREVDTRRGRTGGTVSMREASMRQASTVTAETRTINMREADMSGTVSMREVQMREAPTVTVETRTVEMREATLGGVIEMRETGTVVAPTETVDTEVVEMREGIPMRTVEMRTANM